MSDRTRGLSGLDDADIELLERLGAIAAVVDPVPDHVLEMSRALFAFRDPDAELMEVVELDGDRLEAVRGASPTSRMHFFEFGELSVDVELTVSGGFCDVVGVIADPSGSASRSVTLDTTSASFTTALDDDGRFELRHVPVGMCRLSLERDSRPKVSTPWFEAG
ncbi:MAG TPA: carboxypeptidase regulatory-like domain-containing protein [Lapillicoccus sp.]